MKTIDLHVHSTFSDGSCTPEEIARLAKETGLSAFALTDHDVIAGTERAAAAAKAEGLDFINGMELTVNFKGHKLHVVCLGFDPEHPAFQKVYKEARKAKEGKIPELIDIIHSQGIDISLDKVKACSPYQPLDRYAIMRYMVTLHLYSHAQPLWDNYIDPATKQLGFATSVPAEFALPLIHEAGGVMSLAHFHKKIGLKGMTRAEQEATILELHDKYHLDGMERYYPSYTEEDAEFAKHMIADYGLMATGGTDFHGSNRPNTKLGTGIDNNTAIPYTIFDGVMARLK